MAQGAASPTCHESKVVAALNDEVLEPDVVEAVYERTAKKIKEHFSLVPEEAPVIDSNCTESTQWTECSESHDRRNAKSPDRRSGLDRRQLHSPLSDN